MNSQRRSRVLVTITPYTEQEKRVLSTGASTTGTAAATAATTTMPAATSTASSVPAPPAPPPLPLPAKTKSAEDSVEMQSIESFKLKEAPNPVIPKPPPTYFPVVATATNGSPRHTGAATATRPLMNGKEPSPVLEPARTAVLTSPTGNNRPGTGKVAIRIGAYEGEAKQPSRLDFLSQQSTRPEKNSGEELANGPVVSRLQNELAATLQRSNLRRKTEGESQPGSKPIPENAVPASNNDTTNPEPNKLSQSNVEKLASALSNKVTIKVNPENNSR